MLKLYLDSSAIMKRYVTEPGTPSTDHVFESAEKGELVITFSVWNIGEVFGVLDERLRRGWLNEKEYAETLNILCDELVKLMRLRVLEVIPIFTSLLVKAWMVLLNHHIYQADALQITTCTHTQSDALISGDEKLVKTSRKQGLKAFNVVKEEQKLKNFIQEFHPGDQQ